MEETHFNCIKFFPVKIESQEVLVKRCKEYYKENFVGSFCMNESVYIQIKPACFEALQKDDSICLKLTEPFDIHYDFSENTIEYFSNNVLENSPIKSVIQNESKYFNDSYLEITKSKSQIDSIITKLSNENPISTKIEPKEKDIINPKTSENQTTEIQPKSKASTSFQYKNFKLPNFFKFIKTINNNSPEFQNVISEENRPLHFRKYNDKLNEIIQGSNISLREKLNNSHKYILSYTLQAGIIIFILFLSLFVNIML